MANQLSKTMLQTERERRGWSQGELAGFVGVDTATVCRWETRRRTPRGPAILVLSRLLGVSVADLKSDFSERSAA